MSFVAQIYRIFLASPSDVSEEREAARKVIADWNANNAVHRGIVLLPVGWETHAVPQMMVRPQEHINETVLRDCDVLVGIFWARMGTDAGVGKTGTEEEVGHHLAAKKKAHLYFSNKPVPMNHDADQLKRVKKFKAEIQAKRSGLFGEFSSTTDFQEQFRNHLNMIINALPGMLGGQAPSPAGNEPVKATAMLSDCAAHILKIASSTQQSLVLVKELYITIPGGPLWNTSNNGQLRAILSDALDELMTLDFLRDQEGLGEKLRVTSSGFKFAKTIQDTDEGCELSTPQL